MRKSAAFSLTAVLLVSACAHQTTPPATAFNGMRWIEVAGDEPKLAFGVPDSDVIVVMMSCAPNSGRIDMMLTADKATRPRALTLASGKTRLEAPVTLVSAGMEGPTDQALAEARVVARSPVMTTFAATGDLTVGLKSGREPTRLPAARPAIVQKFVGRCTP